MIGGLLKGIAGTMGRGGKKPAPAPMDEVPRGEERGGKPNLLRKFAGRIKHDAQGAPLAQGIGAIASRFGKRKGPARGGKR